MVTNYVIQSEGGGFLQSQTSETGHAREFFQLSTWLLLELRIQKLRL